MADEERYEYRVSYEVTPDGITWIPAHLSGYEGREFLSLTYAEGAASSLRNKANIRNVVLERCVVTRGPWEPVPE